MCPCVCQMSDSYMWKEQIHTMLKGGESESDISDSEHFLTKGAFLLTPSHGLSMEKASAICEKMEFKGNASTPHSHQHHRRW